MASNLNNCNFTGHLVETPVIARSKTGHTYTRFSIGVNTDVYDKTENCYKIKTSFVKFIAFGDIARDIVDQTSKGSLISIESVYEQSMYRDRSGKVKKGHIFRVTNFDVIRKKQEEYSSSNWIS